MIYWLGRPARSARVSVKDRVKVRVIVGAGYGCGYRYAII